VTIVVPGLMLAAESSLVAKTPKIIEFDTMVGNTQAFTGAQNPIRGINGRGLRWRVADATGELTTSGYLEVKVRGLVLAAGANAGSNPIASFRAVVSCLAGDASVQKSRPTRSQRRQGRRPQEAGTPTSKQT
jgi:hypothetical protein